MELECNEKVLAIYQAVCSLIEEGCDVHKLKVADITSRAGIGKGTAYEYFRTKEEILERALRYDSCLQLAALSETVEKQETFRACMESAFSWMEERILQRRFAIQFMSISREVHEAEEKETGCVENEMSYGVHFFRRMLEKMIEKGHEEGIIREDIPDNLVQLELFSKFFAYFTYLKLEKKPAEEAGRDTEKDDRETRAFLYSNVVKSLGRPKTASQEMK